MAVPAIVVDDYPHFVILGDRSSVLSESLKDRLGFFAVMPIYLDGGPSMTGYSGLERFEVRLLGESAIGDKEDCLPDFASRAMRTLNSLAHLQAF